MANTVLTADIIAKEAIMILDNDLKPEPEFAQHTLSTELSMESPMETDQDSPDLIRPESKTKPPLTESHSGEGSRVSKNRLPISEPGN